MSRLGRQSFLGPDSDEILARATVGIVGLGGGGSHAGQQLAHVGIGNYVLVDPQPIDETNTNRLVGGTLEDVRRKTPKVLIAERVIRGLEPNANVQPLQRTWADALQELRSCDVIMGAVDSLETKSELEAFCRSNLIPFIDIGMTVTSLNGGRFLISGQIIRSMPGHACLQCLGLVTPAKLRHEARRYGDAGENPQVVWSNGVLASTAVGLCVGLLTPWADEDELIYLVYDGNRGTVVPSQLAEEVRGETCPHYPLGAVGQPRFKLRPT